MIEVYGKDNCYNCEKIKKQLNNMNIKYKYISNEKLLMDKSLELHNNKKLIETMAPLILKNGEQIRHKNIIDIKGE